MKFFNFHLMPYRHADLDAIEKHGTAWVTYSNRDYDPEKGAVSLMTVHTANPPRMPIGRLRCGLMVSSAAVEIASKPM